MLSACVGGIRFVSLYGPNGRVVGSPFYEGKLLWYERLSRWLDETRDPGRAAGHRRRLQHRPDRRRMSGTPRAVHGGTHVSEPEREAFRRLLDWGLVDAYRLREPAPGRFSWWDYRAGNFHKNIGMRIDHLLVTKPIVDRVVAAEIDREARKGPPIPSDHAPVTIDLDEPGKPFDAGWEGALERIAAARVPSGRARRSPCSMYRDAARRVPERRLGSPPHDRPCGRPARDPSDRAVEALPRGPRGRPRLHRHPVGRVLLDAWTVWLRQDHDAPDDRRVRAAEPRTDRAPRPGRDRRSARQAPGQHGVPELRPVPAPQRRRQHRIRAAAQERRSRRHPATRRARPSNSSTSRATRSGARRSCPVASSSGSPSPGRSSTGPRSCSSTSRSAPST